MQRPNWNADCNQNLTVSVSHLEGHMPRDVVLIKKVWERIQKIAVLKHVQSYFKANVKKGFPRVPAPLHPCTDLITWVVHIIQARGCFKWPAT